MAVIIGLCIVAAAFIVVVVVIRYYRDDETLRWIRIEKRARTREAAQRVSARYASLPAVTVVPLSPLIALPTPELPVPDPAPELPAPAGRTTVPDRQRAGDGAAG